MKKLLLLVAASLLMVGCGNNGFLSSSQSEQPSSGEQSSEEPVNPEPEVTVKTIEQFLAGPNTKTVAHIVTGKISKFKYNDTKDEYGNMTLIDGTKELKIYGSTITASALKWNVNEYSFTNPKDFLNKAQTNTLKVGDTVTMKLIRCDYENTKEGQGVITNIEPAGEQGELINNISLNKKSATIRPNEILSLVETVHPANSISKEVVWHSENTSIAEVSENGVVIGKSTGTTNIYAEPKNPEHKAEGFTFEKCSVTVDSAIEYNYNYDNYYAGLSTWTNGEDLISKLHNIISYDKNSLAYTGNWATNQAADQALDDLECVDQVYANEHILKTKTYNGTTGWQREHAFCASLISGFSTGDAVDVKGRATDFHNLFASSNSGNGSRGNKNFGYANVMASSYQDKGAYSFDSLTFEPSDYDKGRLTRAIFYMAVMYNTQEEVDVATTLNYNAADQEAHEGHKSTTVHIDMTYEPITIVEENVPYDKYSYTKWYYYDTDYATDTTLRTLVQTYGTGPEGYAAYSNANCKFAIGNRSTLLKWSGYDVDLLEMQHNQSVYENGQNNRNPFVDYPELINYAFGDYADQPGSMENVKSAHEALEMDKDEIHNYAIKTATREYDVGTTFVTSDYTIVGIKNNLSEVPATYEDQTAEYTFREADATTNDGNMTMNILTPINTIKLAVKVNKGSLNSCNYIGLVTSKVKSDFSNGGTVSITNTVDTSASEDWKFGWANESAGVQSVSQDKGVQFGTGSVSVNELVITTTSSKTVDKVYMKANCASKKTINYKIEVGTTTVSSGTIAYDSTGPVTVGANFATITGVITITINGTGASNGAVYVHTLAFNAITA